MSINPAGTHNNVLNFLPTSGLWMVKPLRFVASVAILDGTAVGIEISGNTTTGNCTAMGTENASGADFQGILNQPISTTDPDYATAGKLKNVWVPISNTCEAQFKRISGTLTTADIGKTVEFASSGLGLAVDTPGKGARITDVITSDYGTCSFVMPNTETA